MKQQESKMQPVLKQAASLSWDECQKELESIRLQFAVIHDLPKRGDVKPTEYMYESLELLRKRCNDLHWRMIQLNVEKLKRKK